MSRWYKSLTACVSILLLVPATTSVAQELLTNGGIELVSEAVAGRNAVPPGWEMSEGPWVPELPPGPRPAGWPQLSPWPYEGDYNNTSAGQLTCSQFRCNAVDAGDYVRWRNTLGTSTALPNRHPLNSGPVNLLDYDVWKSNYGKPNTLSMAEPGNFSHLILEGDWHMWFQPYNSNRSENAAAIASNFAHLFQTVPGTPGLQYTMTGWALFEDYFPGGVTNLNLENANGTPTGAPFNDGPLSPTDTFFALEFLDSDGEVLAGSVEIELKANGQPSNTTWMQHELVGVAPAGTVEVRVRASMINGVENPLPCPQCFQMSFFVDAFSLTAANPGGGGLSTVPEPASWLLGTLSFAICVLAGQRPVRPRHGVRRC